MLLYVLRRLSAVIPILLGLTLIAFSLGNMAPGDPAYFALANGGLTEPSDEELAQVREQLGLNDPFLIRYCDWLGKAIQGDWGTSYRTGLPVREELYRRLPITLNLSLLGLLFTVLLGIPGGVAAAAGQNRFPDKVLQALALTVISIPGFWLGILLILIFSEILKILPTSGYGDFRSLIMPSFVLAAGTFGITIRLTRASVLQELQKDYILTAVSKGVSGFRLYLHHALPNALIPVITLLGTYTGNILGGSVLVEIIFALPGMGQMAVNGVLNRDFPIVQAYVLITGVVYIVIHLLIDLLYLFLNPRIRLGGKTAS